MKLLDQNTSSYFKVPELVLMEQAAHVFVEKLSLLSITSQQRKGIVFCGVGNNGADGLAIARLLNEQGITTDICKVNKVWNIASDTSESYRIQESICEAYQFPEIYSLEDIANTQYDFIVDAIFGIGLSRNLNDTYIQIIEFINSLSCTKIAVDMPSGIHSDNGQVMGAAVKCDYTITFSFGKVGQYLWPGYDYAGNTIVADMGITMRSWLDKKPSIAYLQKMDLQMLPERPAHSNKGTFGKLLLIAGSVNMAGAAVLAAKAAYRSGVGLVKIFTHEANREIIQTAIPEAIVSTYGNNLKQELLIQDIQWADAIAIGPGMGTSAMSEEIVQVVRSVASVPIVWDADALNILAQNVNQLLLPHTEYIMTPHLGEFSRLTENSITLLQNQFVEKAIEFSRTYDVICVLKDFHTIVAQPYGLNFLNLSGNNGMATAGSGDVLTGIIGALLAQGYQPSDAASYGTYIHGLAGDMAKLQMGTRGIMAMDIIEGIKEVWNKVENE